MNEKVFGKSEVIFREGDLGDSFFQIVDGLAGVYLGYGTADEKKLTEMKPGQYFGEMAVIEAWPRSTTIRAETELHVIEISENELNAFFAEQPDRILSLMNQLGGRIRELTAEYNEVKSYLEDRGSIAPEKKAGFLAKIKKYLELSALTNKNAGATQEEILAMKGFGRSEQDSTQVLPFKKGEIIFREGDEGNYMYAIHGGTVGIYINYGTTKEKKLATLYSDSFFGEMGLIGEEKRSATAVVEENAAIECIRAEDLEVLFKSNPIKVDMILSHLSHRLRGLTKDYIAACREAVKEN
jgi:CRP-like cAMP-binding protein